MGYDEKMFEQEIWRQAFFECARSDMGYTLEETVAYANGTVDAFRKYFNQETK